MLPNIEYLNRTCIELATANLTFFSFQNGSDIASCTITPEYDQKRWTIATIKACGLTAQLVLLIAFFLSIRQYRKTVRTLRNMPSQQLHRELEEWYAATLSKKERKLYDEKVIEGGRYPSVIYTAGGAGVKKCIIIQENLELAPSEEETRKLNRRLVWKGKEATRATSFTPEGEFLARAGENVIGAVDAFHAGRRMENVAIPQPAVVGAGRGVENGTPEIETLPSYQSIWRSTN